MKNILFSLFFVPLPKETKNDITNFHGRKNQETEKNKNPS